MKKVICGLISILWLFLCAFPTYAQTPVYQTMNEFVFEDGTKIQYYLDEIGNPYRIFNGERVYIALALDHLEVTDSELLAELNARRNSNAIAISPQATNYYDLSNCDADKFSREYTVNATQLTTDFFVTATLIYNAHHTGIEINTDNHSPWYASNKINFIYYFYNATQGRWYALAFVQKNCSAGFRFQHSPSIYPQGYFKILASNNLSSCTVRIFTGPFLPAGGVPIY